MTTQLVLTGAGGQLGSALRELATDRAWNVRTWPTAELRDTLFGNAPELPGSADWVVHCAANTNVEGCEADADACYRDNTLLTERLASAARHAGVRLAMVSSTGVYGSHSSSPYAEYDATVPTTHHHKSKLFAEQAALAASADNLVVRTGWLFGGQPDNPKNFVIRRLGDARAAGPEGLSANGQQRGVPCFAGDIATRLLDLMQADISGVFNNVNRGNASRYEYVSEIISRAGIDVPVRPVGSAYFKRLAQVSDNEMALNWKADQLGFPPMPDWRDALDRYLKSLGEGCVRD